MRGLINAVYKAAVKPADRGMLMTSAPNFIPGNYGPSKNTKRATETVQQVTRDVIPYNYNPLANPTAQGLIEKGMLGAGRVVGFGDTVLQAAKNFAQMQLPSNRVIFQETGLNLPKLKSKLMKDGASDEDAEIWGRLLYDAHINNQVGKDNTDIIKQISEKVGYGYKPLTEGFYQGAESKLKGKGGLEYNPETDAAALEKYFLGSWVDGGGVPLSYNEADKFILKKASAKKSGDHYADFKAKQSPLSDLANFIKNKGAPESNEQLRDLLLEFQAMLAKKKKANKKYSKSINNIEYTPEDNGVWFSYSHPGSSITEGGANYRIKLGNNLKGFAVMSDEHNFLEKLLRKLAYIIPGINPEHRVLAATPPMQFDMKALFKNQLGKRRGPKSGQGQTEANDWTLDGKNIYQYFKELRPQDSAKVRREQVKAVMKLVGAGYGITEATAMILNQEEE